MLSKICNLFLFCLLSGAALSAQTKVVRFYQDAWLEKETEEKKANYSETTTTSEDGTITTEVHELKTKDLVRREAYLNNEPVGTWTYDNGRRQLDYDFKLAAQAPRCPDTIPGLKNYFANNDSLVYKAPVMGPSFFKELSSKINYPPRQREEGTGGKVFLQFIIGETGTPEQIFVLRSAHPALDKEAARVLRQMKFQSPASWNGKAIPVCMTLPISFKIQ